MITSGLPDNAKRALQPRLTEFIPHKPTPRQRAFLLLKCQEAMYGGAAGGGKLLARGGVVLTPFGWKRNEHLRVGDRINAPDGTTQRIIQLKPWVRLPGVRVTFHDGTSTTVAWDHLWLAWRSGKRRKQPGGQSSFGEGSAEVVETRELAQWLAKANQQEREGKRPCWPLIPVCQPQVFNVQHRHPIRLDAYQLGVWLGDGSASGGAVKITSGDMRHTRAAFDLCHYSISGDDLCLTGPSRNQWRNELERAGLLGAKAATKFVPRQYLYASIDDRWAMLQGLMDTDGTVDSRGHLSFCSVSPALADGVKFLVQSLGGTATVTEKRPFYRNKHGDKIEGQVAYEVYIKLRDEKRAFRLPRKVERCQEQPGPMYRRVVAVDQVDEIDGRCLTVSHPSGLYLTNDFIVTHNSDALLMAALQYSDIPGYSALIIRKTMKDADNPGSILFRARSWLAPWMEAGKVKWWPKQSMFIFDTGYSQPATLQFGYLDKAGDKYQYDGAEYQAILFDETTQFYQDDYEYLLTRLRGPADGPLGRVPTRLRSATNPGGRGHHWVKDRFRIEKIPGKKGPTGRPLYAGTHPDRPHIPSFVHDNPYVNQEAYEASLKRIEDPVTREQKLAGDWGVTADGRFRRTWIRRHKLEGHNHISLGPKVYDLGRCYEIIVMDPASSSDDAPGGATLKTNRSASWTVISRWLITPDNDLCLMHVRRFQGELPEIAKNLQEEMKVGQVRTVCQEYTTQSIHLYQYLTRIGLPMRAMTTGGKDKVARSLDATTRMEGGKLWLPQSGPRWLQDYEDEVFTWTGAKEETDDQVDVTSYAAIYVTQGAPKRSSSVPFLA